MCYLSLFSILLPKVAKQFIIKKLLHNLNIEIFKKTLFN